MAAISSMCTGGRGAEYRQAVCRKRAGSGRRQLCRRRAGPLGTASLRSAGRRISISVPAFSLKPPAAITPPTVVLLARGNSYVPGSFTAPTTVTLFIRCCFISSVTLGLRNTPRLMAAVRIACSAPVSSRPATWTRPTSGTCCAVFSHADGDAAIRAFLFVTALDRQFEHVAPIDQFAAGGRGDQFRKVYGLSVLPMPDQGVRRQLGGIDHSPLRNPKLSAQPARASRLGDLQDVGSPPSTIRSSRSAKTIRRRTGNNGAVCAENSAALWGE